MDSQPSVEIALDFNHGPIALLNQDRHCCWKQCRSRTHLIRIYTVSFSLWIYMNKIMELSVWLMVRNGCGKLNNSAGWGLIIPFNFLTCIVLGCFATPLPQSKFARLLSLHRYLLLLQYQVNALYLQIAKSGFLHIQVTAMPNMNNKWCYFNLNEHKLPLVLATVSWWLSFNL